jgi:hypothetical protein
MPVSMPVSVPVSVPASMSVPASVVDFPRKPGLQERFRSYMDEFHPGTLKGLLSVVVGVIHVCLIMYAMRRTLEYIRAKKAEQEKQDPENRKWYLEIVEPSGTGILMYFLCIIIYTILSLGVMFYIVGIELYFAPAVVVTLSILFYFLMVLTKDFILTPQKSKTCRRIGDHVECRYPSTTLD